MPCSTLQIAAAVFQSQVQQDQTTHVHSFQQLFRFPSAHIGMSIMCLLLDLFLIIQGRAAQSSMETAFQLLTSKVLLQVEQATPDVPLPGLKQKGKEAAAIGKAPAQSGPGAADQVILPAAFTSAYALVELHAVTYSKSPDCHSVLEPPSNVPYLNPVLMIVTRLLLILHGWDNTRKQPFVVAPIACHPFRHLCLV